MRTRIVYIDRMTPHPLNREFATTGEKWESFFESVKKHGVMVPPVVRYMTDGAHQVLAGHRRLVAAKLAGIEKLDCIVKEGMSDHEALELLVIENLEREDMDPVEEGKLLKALIDDGVAPEILAHRLSRTLEWVMTRQGLLDLGEEVCAAVRKPKDDEGHLHLGTVQVLLTIEKEDRPRAIQLVLHSEIKLGVLNAREAVDVLKQEIIDPRRKKAEWEKNSRGLVKAWRKRLEVYLTKDERKELIVQAVAWENIDAVKRPRNAEDLLGDVPGVNTEVVDHTKRWVHLAVRNGLPVWIVPAENDAQSDAQVAGQLLIMSEAVRVENGTEYWIGPVPKKQISKPGSGQMCTIGGDPQGDVAAPRAEDEKVAEALHAQEGRGEKNFDTEEKPEEVIEQRMEHWAMIDLGIVRRIKAWADDHAKLGDDWDGLYPANFMPKWIDDWCLFPEEIVEAMDWVLSLKQGAKGQ